MIKPVQNPAKRGCFEKGHGSSHDPQQHTVVQLSRCVQGVDGKENRGDLGKHIEQLKVENKDREDIP